uniref:Butyrophilin subfamily 3 member A2-like Ig-C domain-containing protein n=1 Tax=Oncorhynchus kisutch TaxID=8019 RepID=A0A8C7MFG1_ONCKI
MSWKSWVTQLCFVSILFFKGSYSVEFEIKVPSELQLSIVGQHAVLNCSFPVGKVWDLASSVITWQRGLEVIHSFYYGQDQLDRQSRHYANRTRDFTSLFLITPICVSCDVKSYYPEPHLDFTASPSNVELVLTSQGGYPRPLVQWLDDRGDVTDKTVIHLLEDTHGLYSVFSTLTLQGPVNKTVIFILKNKDLRQIRRAITHHRKRWTILVPIVTFVLLFVLLISALRKTCGPVENINVRIYIDGSQKSYHKYKVSKSC